MIQGDPRDPKEQHQHQRNHRRVDVDEPRPLVRRPFGRRQIGHGQGVYFIVTAEISPLPAGLAEVGAARIDIGWLMTS